MDRAGPAAGIARSVLPLALAAGLALACASARAAAPAAPASSGTAALDRFLDGLRSFRAEFSEDVTAAHGRVVSRSTGELIVLRPGKFRWQTRPADGSGAGELLIADGRNLWYYDPELEQVTVRRESTALTATPAMLLSGGPGSLDAFEVSAAGRSDGLDWVRVVPKAPDADFKEARLGFSGRLLRRMVLDDKLGETATLVFEHAERNAPVAASEVSFTPPAGADVIGKPEP